MVEHVYDYCLWLADIHRWLWPSSVGLDSRDWRWQWHQTSSECTYCWSIGTTHNHVFICRPSRTPGQSYWWVLSTYQWRFKVSHVEKNR